MARIITYGAYNLCFDPTLGQLNGTGPDFFRFLVRNGYPVNRVRLILYRNARQEGLGEEAIPLFVRGQVNRAFRDNLARLVRRARESRMAVQVCFFSYHSIAGTEGPESPPRDLALASLGSDPCARLRRFFSLDDPRVVAAQKALIRDIVGDLRARVGLGNVVFEIANELRSDRCFAGGESDGERNRLNNCALVPWLNAMKEEIRAAALPFNARVTTSTGAHDERILPRLHGEASEAIVFDRHRRTGRCASPDAFTPHYFDLHAGQWEPVGINWVTDRAAYLAALPGSMAAARARLQSYGYPNPVIILNDDGLGEHKRNSLLESYVREAFRGGFGYATKSQYPPEPFDVRTLNIIRDAHRAIQAPVLAAEQMEAAALDLPEPAEA